MKTNRINFLVCLAIVAFFIQSCQKNDSENQPASGILPARFKIDLPSSLSNSNTTLKSASMLKSAEADTLKGNAIYMNLNTFIAVGEGAGVMVETIIGAIALYHIDKPMTITYQSNDDHRTKYAVVTENASYNGKTWKYELTISDAASVASADSGKGLQIFWNPSPIEGIAILKPYNIDRSKNENAPDAVFRLEYSELGTNSYDSYMKVEIANLPLPDANLQPYAIKNLEMYVGKKGDNLDVFGNSDHPNAKFFTENKGFDWAFVASGSISQNISTAEVGIPPCQLDNSTRKALLEDYSIKSVLTAQINEWFLELFHVRPNADDLASYLKNADAPGYFNNNGFVQAGTAPNDAYTALVNRIQNLTPYNPKSVSELSINFK